MFDDDYVDNEFIEDGKLLHIWKYFRLWRQLQIKGVEVG